MFIVIEIQTLEQVATIVNSYESRDEAESKYHQILMYAAQSQVKKHGAVMLTEEGMLIKRECYEHVDDTEEE